MAKLALINREQKRRATVKKYAQKRAELIALTLNPKLSEEDRYAARLQLQQLPRNASPVRLRNRFALAWRPRDTSPKSGRAPNKRRDIAMRGEIPGVIKASW